jgi:prepilin-type N-terminal cleavage/methylation domain-containing protein
MVLSGNISKMNTRRHFLRGFTLAEMAVVVMLMGIMLTMGIGMMRAQMDKTAQEVTQKKQQVIKDALITYLRTNWHLPCPDNNFTAPDGEENRSGDTTTACSAAFGIVPYRTLGLQREVALDGWNQFFSYHVTANWRRKGIFSPGAPANLTVMSAPATPITSNAVALIISHGKNGYGAYTIKGVRRVLPTTADPTAIDEQENVNGNTTYVKRDFSNDPAAVGGVFDDWVLILEAEDLLTPLRNDGSLKAEQDKLNAIKNSIIAQSFATVPCVLPGTFVPVGTAYGSTVSYTRLFTDPISLATTSTAESLFRLTLPAEQATILMSDVSASYVGFSKCP